MHWIYAHLRGMNKWIMNKLWCTLRIVSIVSVVSVDAMYSQN
jgi:hypothetical protein